MVINRKHFRTAIISRFKEKKKLGVKRLNGKYDTNEQTTDFQERTRNIKITKWK